MVCFLFKNNRSALIGNFLSINNLLVDSSSFRINIAGLPVKEKKSNLQYFTQMCSNGQLLTLYLHAKFFPNYFEFYLYTTLVVLCVCIFFAFCLLDNKMSILYPAELMSLKYLNSFEGIFYFILTSNLITSIFKKVFQSYSFVKNRIANYKNRTKEEPVPSYSHKRTTINQNPGYNSSLVFFMS